MFCANCGQDLPPGAAFCDQCGTRLHQGSGNLTRPASIHVHTAPPPAAPRAELVQWVHVPAPAPAPRSYKPKQENSASPAIGAWILLAITCALTFVPQVGEAMAWVMYVPILLIALVLGIISMTKGHTAHGVLIVLCSLIVVPLFLFYFGSVGRAYRDYVEQSRISAAIAAQSAEEMPKEAEVSPDASASEGALSSVWGEVHNEAATPSESPFPQSSQETYATRPDAAEEPAPSPTNAQARTQSADASRITDSDPDESSPIERSSFPYQAIIADSRGEVVLQSGPGIMSSNVAKLRSGEEVDAATQDGEWIMIQTQDNKKGYVRSRQLEFVDMD